jgi:hypothetical protein
MGWNLGTVGILGATLLGGYDSIDIKFNDSYKWQEFLPSKTGSLWACLLA